MNTAVVNIKVDPKVKTQAQKFAASLGLSLSSLINGLLKQALKTRTVTFTDDVRLEPTPYLKRMIRQSEKDIKEGKVISFSPPSEALAYIDRIIADGEKREQSRLHK